MPPIVTSPATKSVGTVGIGNGRQRSWFGGAGTSSNGALRSRSGASGVNGSCTADGRIRYVQLRRLPARGAVNAVPFNSSVYSPYAGCLGLLCPTGSAPGSASVAKSFPNPD